MNVYARGISVLLLGGFGMIALLVAVDSVFPIGAPGQDAAAKALAQHVPPIVIFMAGALALIIAWWLGRRGFNAELDEGDRL